MKKLILFICCLTTTTLAFTQNYKITWGEEVKMKKSATDMNVVAADNSGIYFTEERNKVTSMGFFSSTIGSNVNLVKFDKNFNSVFEKDYGKELKGLSFDNIQMLDNNLFMFATDYDKREKTLKLFGAKLDKNTGELQGAFRELATYNLESRRDNYDVHLDTIENSSNFLMVTDISNKDRTSIAVAVLDSKLKQKVSTIINLSYEKDTYDLEDVKYTASGKIVLLGKVSEHMVRNNGKQKRRMVFKEYALAIYNAKGVKEKDVNTGSGGRFVIGGKLIEPKGGELLLAGFYSNEQKKNDLNGFFINKIDVEKGEMLLSSFKEISSGMLGEAVDDVDAKDGDDGDDDDKKSKKDKKKDDKDDDDDEEFPNSFVIRSIDVNPLDNSYVLTAEISTLTVRTYSTPGTGMGSSMTSQTRTVYTFTNKDILVINADQNGKIKWLTDVPKYQVEQVTTSGYGGRYFYGYFMDNSGMPYYSSFVSLIQNNKLILVLNDHVKNTGNKEYGNRVKKIISFKKRSNTYGVSIDLATGATDRKMISENSGELVLMPRHSSVVGNSVLIPSRRTKTFAKSELKMAKITVQ